MSENSPHADRLPTDSEGRVYIHSKCNKPTTITGNDWVRLCNPFCQTSGTICSHCQGAFPVKDFVWQDTNENILTYLRRVRSKAPILWRMWFWWLGPVAGALVVAIALYFIGPNIPMKEKLPAEVWAGIGAFFGIFLAPYAVTPWLVPLVTGIRFYKEQ